MVSTTLFLSIVVLGGPATQVSRVAVRSEPARAVHLVVPNGVAVPMAHNVAPAVTDLFKSPARLDAEPAVAEEHAPDQRVTADSVASEPVARPSCSL